MASGFTTAICDKNPQRILSGEIRVLPPIFKYYGGRRVFGGPIATLKLFEDNMVRQFLEQKGNGRVLVVDGGGSLRCAIVGGGIVDVAQINGWAGIVVNGCIKDANFINKLNIGVRAIDSNPLKASRKRDGEEHVPITIAGIRIFDGEWLYADADGIVVCKTKLSD